MKSAVLLMLMLCVVTADAHDVYRWVAPDGSVYYSDNPRAGADRITLPEWLPPQPRRHVTPPLPVITGKPVFGVYNRLTITKPGLGENVRDNQGNVEVTLTVEPDLNTTAGHKIRVLLDGKAQGDALASLVQSLSGVERGRHTVTGQVIDAQGRVLISSRPVTFFLKHASPLFHTPPPGTPAPNSGVQQAPRAPSALHKPYGAPFRPAVPPPPPLPKPPKPPPSRVGGSGTP